MEGLGEHKSVAEKLPAWLLAKREWAKICVSRRSTKLFHHEGHEEYLGGVVAGPVYYIPRGDKDTAHRSIAAFYRRDAGKSGDRIIDRLNHRGIKRLRS